jgi:hypothetical protein
VTAPKIIGTYPHPQNDIPIKIS